MQALLNAIATMALPTDAQRIFHGRGGLHPGCEQWALDAFPPVLVLTSFQPVSPDELATVGAALSARWAQIAPEQVPNWVFQCRAEGHIDTRLMSGTVPDPHVVTEHGARFRVHVLKGQNHGLFLDMAEGREWVRQYVRHYPATQPRLKVLNLFAYTCAFSVVALQAGAKQVVNVDMSHGALAIGQQNHPLNDISTGASFLAHDIFKTWGKITRGGPYGLVIVDPDRQRGYDVCSLADLDPVVARKKPRAHERVIHAAGTGYGPHPQLFLWHFDAEDEPRMAFFTRMQRPAQDKRRFSHAWAGSDDVEVARLSALQDLVEFFDAAWQSVDCSR